MGDPFDIPPVLDRRDEYVPGRVTLPAARPARRWTAPAKRRRAKKRARARPTDAQAAFLRDMGYTAKQIAAMSAARARRLIDGNVSPHMADDA